MSTNTIDLSQFGSLEKVGTTIIIIAIFLWIVTIVRVAKDISARTNNHTVQIISILLVTFLTPIIGLPIYHIIKPIGYKKDKMPRREAFISTTTICQNCQTLNAKEHECCIECGKKIKITCKECGKKYPHNYHYCPKCGGPNINL